MQLFEQKIGFPLFGFNNVKITLTAPIIPTAFEKIAVKVIGRFANDDTYSTWSMNQVFTDILGIPEPDFILQRTLDELCVKGIIRCEHSVSDTARQQLHSFSLTEQGKRLQCENILHGVAQERSEDYQYDPIAEKLIDQPSGWKPQKPQAAIDETAFAQTFPSTLIQKRLTENKPDWFTPKTQIGTVEKTAEPIVLWKEQNLIFDVKNGILSIQNGGGNGSKKSADYVNSLSADVLLEFFPENLFRNPSDWASFSLMDYKEFEQLSANDWIPVTGRLDKLVDNPDIIAFNPDWKGYKFGKNRLYFDPQLDRPVRIIPNGARHISVQGEYPFEDAICVTDQYVLRGVRIPVRFSGEQLELPVVIRRKYGEEHQFIADFLRNAVKLANTGNKRYENGEWCDYLNDWRNLMDNFWSNFHEQFSVRF